MSKNKAQFWGIDLMVAVGIFLIIIILFYVYSLNYPSESVEKINEMLKKGDFITDTLLSEGYPTDWNLDPDNVGHIGVMSTEGKIDNVKLESFYDLTVSDYENTKSLFNTKYDYYFNFSENMNFGGGPIPGIGKEGGDDIGQILSDEDPQNLVKITRFTVYDDKPVTAYLYLWEE